MSDPIVIPGEPDTTVIEPDTVIVEANPTIIVPPASEPEPEPESQPVAETCHCLTVEQFEEVMRRVIGDRIPILGEVRASVKVREASGHRVLLTRYRHAAEAARAYRDIAEVLSHAR